MDNQPHIAGVLSAKPESSTHLCLHGAGWVSHGVRTPISVGTHSLFKPQCCIRGASGIQSCPSPEQGCIPCHYRNDTGAVSPSQHQTGTHLSRERSWLQRLWSRKLLMASQGLLNDLNCLLSIRSFFRWGHFFQGTAEDHLEAHSLFECCL